MNFDDLKDKANRPTQEERRKNFRKVSPVHRDFTNVPLKEETYIRERKDTLPDIDSLALKREIVDKLCDELRIFAKENSLIALAEILYRKINKSYKEGMEEGEKKVKEKYLSREKSLAARRKRDLQKQKDVLEKQIQELQILIEEESKHV